MPELEGREGEVWTTVVEAVAPLKMASVGSAAWSEETEKSWKILEAFASIG